MMTHLVDPGEYRLNGESEPEESAAQRHRRPYWKGRARHRGDGMWLGASRRQGNRTKSAGLSTQRSKKNEKLSSDRLL
jgi:hypothetical protein